MIFCNYQLPKGNVGEIHRIHLHSEAEVEKQFPRFFWEFLVKNRPCIVVADHVKHWPAMRDWVSSDGDINFDFLLSKYGDVQVPVTEITDSMTTEYGGMNCSTMLFKDYAHYWIESKDKDLKDVPCLYLKDWHILRNCGAATEKPYEPIQLFTSDWLNEVSTFDDFRFTYMGPKGSRTPFHMDVYGSFSWSINIIGRKKWRLYQPGKETHFMNSANQIVYTPESPGTEGLDYVEVIQEAGETIFVPSGYYHVVWNETDVISINHNWFNASNICFIWHQLSDALNLVKIEINDLEDCPDFSEQCQHILRANHGMNYNDFCELVMKIWNIRMAEHKIKTKKEDGDNTFNLCTLDLIVLQHLILHHLMEDSQLDVTWKNRLQAEQNNVVLPTPNCRNEVDFDEL